MSRKIQVTYLPEPSPRGVVFRPKILVWISKESKHGRIFHALVDSGSDRNLFPASLGEAIGIDIKSGKSCPVYGIGNIKLTTYEHEVELHLGAESFKTTIDFSYEQEMPLLGRNGFFDLFKRVEFREEKKEVEFKV
jgi:hypothetical protein